MMFRLTQKAIDALNEQKPESLRQLAVALDVSENSVYRHLRDNLPNGDLTKIAAIEVVRQVTGLNDSQILESATEKVEA